MTHPTHPFRESLYETAVRLEYQRHHARVDELKGMRKRLELLDAQLRPLLALGLVIDPSEIDQGEDDALSPMPDLLTEREQASCINGFKALGFTELAIAPGEQSQGPFQKVHLSNGQLHLEFTVYRQTTQAKP